MTATLPTWLAIGAILIAVIAGIVVAKSLFRIVLVLAVLAVGIFVFNSTFPELSEAVLMDLTRLLDSAKELFSGLQEKSGQQP